jgi:predicted kinase
MNLKQYISEAEKPDLVLVRGIPGSGKSTYVKNNLKGYNSYEADMFHMKNGKYAFDRKNLPAAHKWCFDKTKKDLEDGKKVVVSNTFINKKEVDRYLDMAKELGKTYEVLRTSKEYGSIHNVPKEVIDKMKKSIVNVKGEKRI